MITRWVNSLVNFAFGFLTAGVVFWFVNISRERDDTIEECLESMNQWLDAEEESEEKNDR